MSTTWRISKSRPNTGSSLPVLAFSVRFIVNWSMFGVLDRNRIILTASHQNVDYLANFKVASQHGIELAGLGFLREINRELVEVRSFAAGACASRRRARCRGRGRHGRLRFFA